MASVIFSKSSDVNNSIFGKSQEPVRAVITQGVESFEAKSLLSTVYSMDTSTSFAEKYTSETSLGDFEDVGENGAYPKASMQEGFAKVIEPTTWKSSFEVTQELVEDGKFGKMKSRASIFTTSYNRTREKFGAALLAGGVGTSVTISGKKEITRLEIKPEVCDPDDIEMLQDLIIVAVNEGLRQIDEISNSEMSKLTGGLGIPGL